MNAQRATRVADLQEIRPSCPACKTGTIEIITDGQVGEAYMPGVCYGGRLETRLICRPFGACNACEFCIEIDVRLMRRSA